MIAVLGSGSWATAMVKIVCETNHKILWWVREPEIVEEVSAFGRNPFFLSQCELDPSKIIIDTDIRKIVAAAETIILVVPSAFVSLSLQEFSHEDFKGKKIYSAVKGIIPETNQVVAEYLKDRFGIPFEQQAVISGPSHAEEVAQGRLTFLEIASPNIEFAQAMEEHLRCRYVRTFAGKDLFGIEYGAVLKNIYAVATGICKGLSLGDNAVAVLISNAIREMHAILQALYPLESRDIGHFVYLGDLLVTAYSQHSRNRVFGTMIGSGYSIESAKIEMKMVAEGYYATKCMYEILQEKNLCFPIVKTVYRILYEGCSPYWEMKHLFNNDIH